MNRTGNGEGHQPLAGTVAVPVGPAVTKPGDETRPPRGSRAAAGGPALAGGHGAVTKAGHATRNTP
jgi:hypothetical protein